MAKSTSPSKSGPAPRSARSNGTAIPTSRQRRCKKNSAIKPNAIFNRQAFNKAFNKVKEYYVKKGYFESQLQYAIIPDSKTNEVDILIDVREGRSGKIDNIVFKGFTNNERSEILGMIYTKKYNLFTSWLTGTGIYNEEALEQDKLTIINFLQNKGYADAKVDIQVKEAKTEGKIILEITADRGPIFHFGKITFKGNTLFTDKEIDAAVRRPPGRCLLSGKTAPVDAKHIKDLYGRKGYIDANVQYETQLVSNEPVYNVYLPHRRRGAVQDRDGSRLRERADRSPMSSCANPSLFPGKHLTAPNSKPPRRRLKISATSNASTSTPSAPRTTRR